MGIIKFRDLEFSTKRITIKRKYYTQIKQAGRVKARVRWTPKKKTLTERISERLGKKYVLNVYRLKVSGGLPLKKTQTDFAFDLNFEKFRTLRSPEEITNDREFFRNIVDEAVSRMQAEYPFSKTKVTGEINDVGIEVVLEQEADSSDNGQIVDSYEFVVFDWTEQRYYSTRGTWRHDTK